MQQNWSVVYHTEQGNSDSISGLKSHCYDRQDSLSRQRCGKQSYPRLWGPCGGRCVITVLQLLGYYLRHSCTMLQARNRGCYAIFVQCFKCVTRDQMTESFL